jgi:uncharacterized protein
LTRLNPSAGPRLLPSNLASPISLERALKAARRAPRRAARGMITLYRYTFSPLIGMHCRHLPTCSDYADEAIARFGLWAGGWITLARLCRCHPAGTRGLDLVPSAMPADCRWYLPWRYGHWRGTIQLDAPSTRFSPVTSPVCPRSDTRPGAGKNDRALSLTARSVVNNETENAAHGQNH